MATDFLTEQRAKDDYLKDPSKCLYCQSDDISTGEHDYGLNAITIEVKCHSCGKEWQDHYTLTNVTTQETKKDK